jgi:uncharacterized caspase-like protein
MPAHAARQALVIGNAAYADGALKNPVNDARAMDGKLTALGFKVMQVENLTRQQIGRTLTAFANTLKPGDEVVVFYAGHGVQVKGINYLPAVDADIQSEEDVALNSLNLNTLMERLDEAKAGLKLLFLDACRNNPYARSLRSNDRGLARVSAAPSGTLIHFATRPGSVAADGTGSNGLYTSQLLRFIDAPDLPVETMLKRVSAAVTVESKKQQEPWTEGGIVGEFYFKPGATATTVKPDLLTSDAQVELQAWTAAQSGNTAAGYSAYLEEYPKGRFAAAARVARAALSATPAVAQAAPQKVTEAHASQLGNAATQPAQATQVATQQTQAEKPRVAAVSTGRRKALVIGNASYVQVSKLETSRADARSVGKTLMELGFDVSLHLDLSERSMNAALRAFKAKTMDGDDVVFFFAGHGVQVGGSSYLLPTDIHAESEDQIKADSIQLERLLDDMREKNVGFMLAVIDACSKNPLRDINRALGSRGLAATTVSSGRMVMYSCSAGERAMDKLTPTDRDPNGVFTRVFLKEMVKPGVSVDRVMRNVRNEVARLTNSVGYQQTPALYDQAVGEFFFKP